MGPCHGEGCVRVLSDNSRSGKERVQRVCDDVPHRTVRAFGKYDD